MGNVELDLDEGGVYTVEVGGLFAGFFLAKASVHATMEGTTDDTYITLHEDGPRPSLGELRQPTVGGKRLGWAEVFALPVGEHLVKVERVLGFIHLRLQPT